MSIKYKQVAFVGYETLLIHIDKGYQFESEKEYIIFDNILSFKILKTILDYHKLSNMKIYSINQYSEAELIEYSKSVLKENHELILRDTFYKKPHAIINLNDCNKGTINKKMIIITPSIRPENLLKIEKKLDFSFIEKWVIIYDGKKINENPRLFESNMKIVELIYTDLNSISGNAQRNFGLDFIKGENNYVYFLDDDNMVNEELYKLLGNVEDDRIYSFGQKRDANVFPYVDVLKGDVLEVYRIDSGMVLIDNKLIGDTRWKLDKYNADGHFIKECFMKNEDKWIFVDNIISGYNNL